MYDELLFVAFSAFISPFAHANVFYSQGGEDQVRAKFYSIAFKQVYNEDDGLVQWTVVDYEFAGDIPYL